MIELQKVSKRYGDHQALAPLTLSFPDGATTALIGESGCGKSTLLKLIVGLIAPTDGLVRIDDETLTTANITEVRHKIGYVIQEGGLFPHLTAEGNVVLLAKYLGRERADLAKRVAELAELVQLPQALLSRYPADLSGGQRQRVGLMRALMIDPPYLLLDEPLGALDPITRRELQTELKGIFERLGKTVILVTHDMGEAAYLAHRIVLMKAGEIVQDGTLDDITKQPASQYVTDFIRAQRSPIEVTA